jgi:CRP-like cAMP-binding protein
LRVDSCNCATSRVEALTACEVGEIDLAAFQLIMQRSPAFAIGIARHLARELVRAEDHVMRLGRMTAYERVCSLLLEIYVRQRRGFSAPQGGVDFPITQTLLADVLGLSVVHVNRQIMRLRREGAVTLTRRALIVHDERLLAQVCRFQDRLYPDAAEIRLAS